MFDRAEAEHRYEESMRRWFEFSDKIKLYAQALPKSFEAAERILINLTDNSYQKGLKMIGECAAQVPYDAYNPKEWPQWWIFVVRKLYNEDVFNYVEGERKGDVTEFKLENTPLFALKASFKF